MRSAAHHNILRFRNHNCVAEIFHNFIGGTFVARDDGDFNFLLFDGEKQIFARRENRNSRKVFFWRNSVVHDERGRISQIRILQKPFDNFVGGISRTINNDRQSPKFEFAAKSPHNFAHSRKQNRREWNCHNQCDRDRNFVVRVLHKNAHRDSAKSEERANAKPLHVLGRRRHYSRIQISRVEHNQNQRNVNIIFHERTEIYERMVDEIDDKKSNSNAKQERDCVHKHKNNSRPKRACSVKIASVIIFKILKRAFHFSYNYNS